MTCWLCGFETTELATNPKAPTCKNGPCQNCIEIANLDEEINQEAATLRRLLVKRCDLRSEQNRVHGIRLPAKLTSAIFELLRPLRDEWGGSPPSAEPSTGMPLYLASICKSWRDIAWSNPLLWSTIHIVVGTKRLTSDASSRIQFVHDWILRSRSLPLTLHIDAHETEGLEDELKGVIEAITQCSDRWHSLSLSVPLKLFNAFHLVDFQCHLLRRLRIDAKDLTPDDSMQTGPLFKWNPTASPEMIELGRVSFQSIEISWNHLTSAKVEGLDLESIAQLFQHASQMTFCHIDSTRYNEPNFSMPQIIHQKLRVLSLWSALSMDVAPILVGSLTLPSLQEFRTNEVRLLIPAYLPALVHRSSSLLTGITIYSYGDELQASDDLQPLPGVSDLVLEQVHDHVVIQKILLEEYFPDLRQLILRLHPFLFLWNEGVIPLLLDRNWLRLDAPEEGRCRRILVVDQNDPLEFDEMWKSDVGKQLKALNIRLMEDGFEFL